MMSLASPRGVRCRSGSLSCARGQAAVELVALVPLALLIVLAGAQLVAAGAARELAGLASEAGAAAMLQGDDPARTARSALPGWTRDATGVRVIGRQVTVTLRPPSIVPGLAGLLRAEETADAGPAR